MNDRSSGPVLALNPGSSSVKAALVAPSLEIQRFWNLPLSPSAPFELQVRSILNDALADSPCAVGCRVVDGGPELTCLSRVDESLLSQLQKFAALSPLHAKASLDAMHLVSECAPTLPQYAVFDAEFHASMPALASTYALPEAVRDAHRIRRLGFHGLAYRSVVRTLRGCDMLPPRLVACQLGSGASVCAIQEGKSVDTSMGFTPLEGLIMGTRSGTLDPGILLLLLDRGYNPAALSQLLNRESGLLGLSGSTSNVRDLEEAERKGDGNARFSLDLFAMSAAKHVAAMAVSMGGLDAISFSGGIGENSDGIRHRVIRRLAFLGFAIGSTERGRIFPQVPDLAAPGTKPIWIVKVSEEVEIADQVFGALG